MQRFRYCPSRSRPRGALCVPGLLQSCHWHEVSTGLDEPGFFLPLVMRIESNNFEFEAITVLWVFFENEQGLTFQKVGYTKRGYAVLTFDLENVQ